MQEDLVSPSHHLKSADHWLPLSSSLVSKLLWKNLLSISEAQGSRHPVGLPLPGQSSDHQLANACVWVLLLLFLLVVCLREFQITHDNWCHLLIADLYTLLAKKESSHYSVLLNSNVLHGTAVGVHHTDRHPEDAMMVWNHVPCLGLPFSSQGPIVSSPCCPVCGKKEILNHFF